MARKFRGVPDAGALLSQIYGEKPLAIILASHNGSGKSTFWYTKLADVLKIPFINADRLTLSILPEPEGNGRLRMLIATLN